MVRDASPDVSVIIPTYNRKELLQQAITSCFAGNEALDVKVVVVDDGSTDGTREYLEQLDDERVRPIFQEHRGGQHARNRGLAEAEGQYVKFLDDDDRLTEGGLQKELSIFRSTGVDLCFGYYKKEDAGGTLSCIQKHTSPNDLLSALFEGAQFTIPLNVTYRNKLLEDIRWDPSLPCGQDYAFFLEVATTDPNFEASHILTGVKKVHRDSVSLRAHGSAGAPWTYARMIMRSVENVRAKGRLTAERKASALGGLWKWARVLSARDWAKFEQVNSYLEELERGYKPKRKNILRSTIDDIFGRKITEGAEYLPRKIKHTFFRA